ncbi:IS21-like element ISPsy14 family transposase [Arenicella sp. 4NH20-0111]|uniref:IS21 family transposase n=1 Tax=Arenicella sp. 4NH20-0111 TaxID=3127648 RepID=UPI003107A035
MKLKQSQMRYAVELILSTSLSNRKIAKMVGLAPNTIRRYRLLLKDSGHSLADVKEMGDMEIRSLLKGKGLPVPGKRLPDWDFIYAKMQRKHQVLTELWEDYRLIDPGDAYSYSQFTHYFRRFCAKLDITMRQTHIAGEVVFTDFCGKRIPYRSLKTGQELMAEVFVACMGCSNYTFAYAVPSQKSMHWIEAHNAMLRFYGGVPEVEVPDNLKSAVTKAGKIPELNRTFNDWAIHYGIVIIPSRVRKPQDKSKAENAVRLITIWIINKLQQETFFSVAEINARIAELLEAFNNRSFKRLPGNRLSRFNEFDKPMLNPLPAHSFEYAEWISKQKVGPDYHVYVDNHAYSVPFMLVSEDVEARLSEKVVELYFNGKRIAMHARQFQPGGHTTNPEHRPDKHKAYAEQTADKFIKWSKAIGPAAMQTVYAQFEGKPDYSYVGRNACSQLQSLAKQYGDERFEHACSRAAAIRSFTVKSIRSILQRKLDLAELDGIPLQGQLPLHQNVRGSEYFKLGGQA